MGTQRSAKTWIYNLIVALAILVANIAAVLLIGFAYPPSNPNFVHYRATYTLYLAIVNLTLSLIASFCKDWSAGLIFALFCLLNFLVAGMA